MWIDLRLCVVQQNYHRVAIVGSLHTYKVAFLSLYTTASHIIRWKVQKVEGMK